MPELPELQVIGEELTDLMAEHRIKKVIVHNHIVVHSLTVDEFVRRAVREEFQRFETDGKFIIMNKS